MKQMLILTAICAILLAEFCILCAPVTTIGPTAETKKVYNQKTAYCYWVCTKHPDMGGNYCQCDSV